jgi:hypothetical protein
VFLFCFCWCCCWGVGCHKCCWQRR